ncbi:MAG: hypothetical protein GY861_05835 [bacterium]|nr:hypothetical protein [bacterium]
MGSIVYQCSSIVKGKVDPALGHARPRVCKASKRRSEELRSKWSGARHTHNNKVSKYSLHTVI